MTTKSQSTNSSKTIRVNDIGKNVGDEAENKGLAMHHRRSTRWMHWINFPLLTIMIWSGFRVYWADVQDPNVIGVGSFELFELFPDWFNEALGLRAKLAAGLGYHLIFGWIFIINGLSYTMFTIKSGHWRDLNPGRRGFRKALAEVKSSFTGGHQSDPTEGYNPAQRITYNSIVALGGVAVLTGFAIYRPNTLSWLTTLFGGYQTAKDIHFIATLLFIGFFFVHVAQVVRAGRAGFVAMVSRSTPVRTPQTTTKASTDTESVTSDEPSVTSETDNSKDHLTDEPSKGDGDQETPEIEPEDPPATERKLALPSSGRRALITAGLTVGASALGWRWLQIQPRDDRLPAPLRSGHEFVESVWRPLDKRSTSARTFAPSEAGAIRVNGRHGIREEIDLDEWSLTIRDISGAEIDTITMQDLATLPETSITTEHICIEGWSQVVTWTGVRFSDFIDLYSDKLGEYSYVNLATPDEEYYVSLDAQSMQHPFTLLAYALNGETLTQEHGAPLRLATPVKYGIKQIKRIGSIEFSNNQGPDYWTERGYDWYAHL